MYAAMSVRPAIKKIVIIAGGVFAAALPIAAFAQTKISLAIPGSNPISTSTAPGYLIANLYQFALLIGGLLAFGAIVYGGVKYVTSGGNPSSQSEAKEWIWSALLGLLLLVCAYLILATINPNLVHLDLPTLSSVNIAGLSGGGGGTGGNPVSGPGGSGCATGQCGTLPNCTPSANVNCGGAPEMVATLNCIQALDNNFNVSEGYPPTGAHSSQCHNNGCCVDTTVSGGSCASVSALISAAQQCGATVANEYTGCGGQGYTYTTGGNVHINSPHTNGC
jgi:hypothetical protein